MKRASAVARIAAVVGVGAARPLRAEELTPLKISSTPVDSSGEPYFALDAGFARSAGLALELVPSQNGAAIAAAVASGAIDIGNGNLVSTIQAHAKGLPFVCIAPGGLYNAKTPSTVLFVPNGSAAKSGRDFDGKTIAVNTLRGLPQFGVAAWVDRTGGRSENVKFVEMSPPDTLIALRQSRVDGAALVEPFVTPAREVGIPIAQPFDAIAPTFAITSHFATVEFARAHPQTIRRFQECIAKTAAWANKNHEPSGEILMKYAKLGRDTLRTMQRTVFAERLEPSQMQPVIDLAVRYGGVSPFPAAELIYR